MPKHVPAVDQNSKVNNQFEPFFYYKDIRTYGKLGHINCERFSLAGRRSVFSEQFVAGKLGTRKLAYSYIRSGGKKSNGNS